MDDSQRNPCEEVFKGANKKPVSLDKLTKNQVALWEITRGHKMSQVVHFLGGRR